MQINIISFILEMLAMIKSRKTIYSNYHHRVVLKAVIPKIFSRYLSLSTIALDKAPNVHAEKINIKFCWSVNISVILLKNPGVNDAYGFVFAPLAVPKCLSRLTRNDLSDGT